MRPADIYQLERDNARLREENEALRARVRELEEELERWKRALCDERIKADAKEVYGAR